MSVSALVKRCGVSLRSSLLPKTRLAPWKRTETFGAELGSTHYESPSQTRWMGPKLPEKGQDGPHCLQLLRRKKVASWSARIS